MDKEFVPYQQSIDMKELGFNEPCLIKDTEQGEECAIYYAHNNGKPTFSQALRWFREKYELYSFVSKWDEGFSYETYREGVTQNNDSFDTYEEAELACLIKLIEITKSGSLKA